MVGATTDGAGAATFAGRLRSPALRRRNRSGGLEQLDRVAGWVVEQDLLSAPAADDLVAKARPRTAQGLDFGGQVLDLELNAVPAARLGPAPVGHRLGGSSPTRGGGSHGGRGPGGGER